jgi:Sec-independent protein translocase protein TatA
MFILIAVILLIGLGLYLVTSMGFEMGDGFTEMKRKARDVDYEVLDEKNNKNMLQ